MTFTQFIRTTTRPWNRTSFLSLARNDDLWPAQSNRLEDFEAFILSRLEEEAEEVIPELRELWSNYADKVGREGKHDLDLALAAWGDYARHHRDCSGSSNDPCPTDQDLFDKAVDASGYDIDIERPSLPCGGVEDDYVPSLDELVERNEDDNEREDEFGEWEKPALREYEDHSEGSQTIH